MKFGTGQAGRRESSKAWHYASLKNSGGYIVQGLARAQVEKEYIGNIGNISGIYNEYILKYKEYIRGYREYMRSIWEYYVLCEFSVFLCEF